MPAARPIVDSEGGKYASLTEAASAAWTTPGRIHTAVQATRCGKYYEIDGVLWAYADEVPEMWPQKELQHDPLSCPMRYCGYCPYRDAKLVTG